MVNCDESYDTTAVASQCRGCDSGCAKWAQKRFRATPTLNIKYDDPATAIGNGGSRTGQADAVQFGDLKEHEACQFRFES